MFWCVTQTGNLAHLVREGISNEYAMYGVTTRGWYHADISDARCKRCEKKVRHA